MVRLDKIYTRTGDAGRTGLGDGSRVSKIDDRIVAGGSIDEMNCQIGMAVTFAAETNIRPVLIEIQQRLFDLGADLSCPFSSDEVSKVTRIATSDVQWLEHRIDDINAALSPLTSFVLPGGSSLAASLHLARAICRRSEIDVIRLQQGTAINQQIVIFLNRLSDLLFVMARSANALGTEDVLWIPSAKR